ncbi:MAG: DUF3445 domain-containing protein [Actinomycetes bacterium]
MAERGDNHDTASPRWPGNDKPYRITMGMRACSPADWLLRGPLADEMIAEKTAVLEKHHEQAVVITAEGDAGAREAAAVVLAAINGDAHQASAADDSMHPLEVAARLVAEDLVIMSPASTQESAPAGGAVMDGATGAAGHTGEFGVEYVLTAAVLCAPSRWDLHEKVGRSMREIHQPVPNYDTIAAAADRFFVRLAEGDIIERTNWTVLDSPEGFQPVSGKGWDATLSGVPDVELPQSLWLRLERQTLRRLPITGDVLFSILTTSTRLDELSSLGPDVTRQLAGWVSTSGQDVHAYRGWGSHWPRVAEALEAACSSSNH